MELLVVGFLALLLVMVATANSGGASAQVVTMPPAAPPRSGGGGAIALVALIIVGLLLIGSVNFGVAADRETPPPSSTPTPKATVVRSENSSRWGIEIWVNKW